MRSYRQQGTVLLVSGTLYCVCEHDCSTGTAAAADWTITTCVRQLLACCAAVMAMSGLIGSVGTYDESEDFNVYAERVQL